MNRWSRLIWRDWRRSRHAEAGAWSDDFGGSGHYAGGLTRQAVDKRRQAGKLIVIPQGERGFGYPVCQFNSTGPVAGLEQMLVALGSANGRSQLTFLLNPNSALDNHAPWIFRARPESRGHAPPHYLVSMGRSNAWRMRTNPSQSEGLNELDLPIVEWDRSKPWFRSHPVDKRPIFYGGSGHLRRIHFGAFVEIFGRSISTISLSRRISSEQLAARALSEIVPRPSGPHRWPFVSHSARSKTKCRRNLL